MPAKVLIILLTGCLLPSWAQAQDFDITQASLYYPHRFVPGDLKMEVALSQIKLPFDWLETSVQAPLFQFHVNYGLPKNFSLDSRFSTLLVSNQISVGPRWHFQRNKFSFNLGYDVGFAFGYLNQFGFDTSASTWINYPNFSLGYRLGEITFTLKGEVVIVTSLFSSQGDNVVESEKNFFNGYTLGLYMEQRLYRNKVLVLGIKNNYARYHYMAWPAFSTFNRFYSMPEFYIGLVL
ncbi:MAG: hypothetical protein SH819_03500 [Cytophagales bacterium]|nr:hypothetical protein [Cytophagales bacterium]